MDALERMPGDAEAAGAVAAIRSANWWSVGDLLHYRRPGGPRTAARVIQTLSNERLLCRVENFDLTVIVDPSEVVGV